MQNTLDYILNKYKIEVGNQYFIDIPEIIGAEGLAKLFAELKFTYGVEIGVDQGEYSEVLLKTLPELTLYSIDPWRAEAYEKGFQPESNEPQEYFDKRYQETKTRLDKYQGSIILKGTSMQKVKEFDDETLDFVYIDGNHDFVNTTLDIHYWSNKVRPGGIVAGHDFVRYPSGKFNHVKKVVEAYTTSYHYLPVFLVTPTNDGMKRDRFRSWFFIKPL